MTDILITKYIPKYLISTILVEYMDFDVLHKICNSKTEDNKKCLPLVNFISKKHKKIINIIFDNLKTNSVLKVNNIDVIKYYLNNILKTYEITF